MTSSPTPNSPTPSRHRERCTRALLALGSLWCSLARSHEESAAVPTEPGWRLGAALAVADVNASQALPSQKMGGYLLRGDSGVDRRSSALEHGVIEAAWRWSQQWSAYAAAGKHDTDPAHTEAAWVRHEWTPGTESRWSLQAGRMRPQMGPVMTQAGHLDRFSLMPLAKRLATDGDWIDDGVQLSTPWAAQDWTGVATLGVWRGQAFPGSKSASPAPSLHLGAARGDWRADVFAAALSPRGRGALTQSSTGAHTHNAPDCASVQAGVFCFDGDSQLLSGSLQWQSHDWPVTIESSYWLRDEQGVLQSINGLAAYSGNKQGGWLQALIQVHPDWVLGLRSERIRTRVSLDGAGARLLAQEAGLPGSAPLRRDTAMVGWQLHPDLRLSAEAGRELQGGQRVNVAVLRLLWRTSLQCIWPWS